MCKKTVDTCHFMIDWVSHYYKIQKMCVKYCLSRYNTQEIWEKAVGACLSALKFVTD